MAVVTIEVRPKVLHRPNDSKSLQLCHLIVLLLFQYLTAGISNVVTGLVALLYTELKLHPAPDQRHLSQAGISSPNQERPAGVHWTGDA